MDKEISIVIPTFNRRDFLKTTLNAFKNQTFFDFEVIVADDGSTDGTAEMIKTLVLPFPVKHSWQKNAGRSAARNMGAISAPSKIILFVDDHNIPDKHLIEEHLAYHLKFKPDKLGAVRGHMVFIDDPQAAPANAKPLPFMTRINLRLGEQDPLRFHTGNVSVVKEAFLKIGGFDEKIKEYGFEDQEFGYRLKKAGYQIKFNPAAVNNIFKVPSAPEKEYDKARQAGHCAVLCYKKFPWFGFRTGANPINLLLFRLLSLGNNWWLRKAEAAKDHDRIKYFYFLLGVWEGFNPGSAVAMGPKPSLKK
jgi:glycosyltransferase involved in cell wall biosynthesis